MTLANQITIARLALIPVFVGFALAYGTALSRGEEQLWLRVAALIAFALASLSDALDGWVARHYHQDSPLGRTLDPVADKLLLLSGVLVLSFTHWHAGLPVWFAVLVVFRDLLIVFGVLFLHRRIGRIETRPILSSKICTCLQLACVCWVLLDFWSTEARPLTLDILIGLAALFTAVSGARYVMLGIGELKGAARNS